MPLPSLLRAVHARLVAPFERLIDPVAPPGRPAAALLGTPVPDHPPPRSLMGFYWHFARQARGPFAALFAAGLLVALMDALIPLFIGRVVAILSTHAPDRLAAGRGAEVWAAGFWAGFWAETGWTLAAMAGVVLVGRPLAILSQNLITQQAINPAVTALIRWQAHWHVVRQGLSYFQEDFAGRIANRVMGSGPALRESVVQAVNAVWYILVYGTGAVVALSGMDWRLALPIPLWALLYVCLLRVLVPRLRDRSRAASEARSLLTGRVVDSYTNVLLVKLFARARDEDAFVRESAVALNEAVQRSGRLITLNSFLLSTLNAGLITGTAALAVWLWSRGHVGLGAVATALPMAWQLANISGWVAFNVNAIFENLGVVQEAMGSVAVPPTAPDPPGARPLRVTRGEMRFEGVRFGYGRETGVLDGFTLHVRPGERVGLVGRSGAGKTTAVSLLLRFFEPEEGRILVDGQDIATVEQESLRAAVGVVSQDAAMLHRSIRDNIRYGRPGATEEEVVAAAKRAAAHEFILGLRDWKGRTGYDAHAGERGVKLSGGQRQRIAIARVLLKDAPILVLDEATSALDSESEAAIQENLLALMEGKTVLAIAHRLSTLSRMDRLVVLDGGRVAESGTHEQLLARGGLYAGLWRRQSGAFVEA